MLINEAATHIQRAVIGFDAIMGFLVWVWSLKVKNVKSIRLTLTPLSWHESQGLPGVQWETSGSVC